MIDCARVCSALYTGLRPRRLHNIKKPQTRMQICSGSREAHARASDNEAIAFHHPLLGHIGLLYYAAWRSGRHLHMNAPTSEQASARTDMPTIRANLILSHKTAPAYTQCERMHTAGCYLQGCVTSSSARLHDKRDKYFLLPESITANCFSLLAARPTFECGADLLVSDSARIVRQLIAGTANSLVEWVSAVNIANLLIVC